MKKRVFAMLLTLVMLLSLLPTTALATDYSPTNPKPDGTDWAVGDTYTSNSLSNPNLPEVPDTMEWVYYDFEIVQSCGKEEHKHAEQCYSNTCICNRPQPHHHSWRKGCYEQICELEEHKHSVFCDAFEYTWILRTKETEPDRPTTPTEGQHYRDWWPVYWSFETRSAVKDSSKVTVTAGSVVKYAASEVDAGTALSDDTANAGQAIANGFTMTAEPGYYVSRYRLVCGNHTDCAIVGYGAGTEVNTSGDYSASISYIVTANDFNHNYDEDSKLGPNQKPTDGNLYNKYDSVNVLYPFYLLIEVKQDNRNYSASYNWGILEDALDTDPPTTVTNLKRSQSFVVAKPTEAIDEAVSLGYRFTGWKIEGSGYGANEVIVPNGTNTAAIRSGSLTLTAQWEPISYTITYDLDGGTVITANPTSYTAATDTFTLNNPTKQDSEFLGWTGTGLVGQTQTVTITKGSTGNRTYTAHWQSVAPKQVVVDLTDFGKNEIICKKLTLETGATMPEDGLTFTATIMDADDKTIGTGTTEKFTKADTKAFAFTGSLTFTQVGEYTYTVTETAVTGNNVTYDNNSYTMTVSVTKKTDANELQAEVSFTGGELSVAANKITFQNKVEPTPADLSVTKTVTKVGGAKVNAGDTIPTAYPGDEIEWTITVTNNGQTAGTFTLTDSLEGVTLAPVQPANGYTVAANGSTSIKATYTVPENIGVTGVVNTVTMTPAGKDSTDASADKVPTANKLTITYDANGGTWEEDVSGYVMGIDHKTAALTVASPYQMTSYIGTNPTWEGKTFKGWYYDEECKTAAPATVNYTLRDSITLYAGWEDEESKPETVQVTVRKHLLDGTTDVTPKEDAAFNLVNLSVDSTTTRTALIDQHKTSPISYYGGSYEYDATKTTVNKTTTFDGTVQNGDAIDLYFVLKTSGKTTYTVEFYYDDVINSSKTETVDTKVGSTISKFDDALTKLIEKNLITGYKCGKVTPETLTVTETAANNVIKVYYVPASYAYTVKYYKDSFENEPVETVAASAAYGSTIPYDEAKGKTVTDAFYGYKFEKTEGQKTVTEKPENNVLKVLYGKDSSVTVEKSYTVKYYKDGVLTDTEEIKEAIWVNDTVIPVDASKINTTNKYEGYSFQKTVPAALPATIAIGGVIEVYYTKNFVPAPSLTVTKTVNTTSAKVGITLKYTVTVKNTGNVVLEKVQVADTLKRNGTPLTTLDLYQVVNGKKVVVETIETLEIGETVTLYADYTVMTSDAGKTLVNTAVAENASADGQGTSQGTEIDSIKVPTLNVSDHYAYVVGYPDGTVQPQGNITRAEAATIFFRLLSDDSRSYYWSTTNDYTDVNSGDWYNNAISTLSNAGIITGYPDGTFRPNASITRAEMAKIIAVFAKLDTKTDRFTDINGHWAEAYIRLAAGNDWIEGYPDSTFKPQQSITRAETMTMINRVLERVPAKISHLLPYDKMLTFVDNNPGDWFYIAVQEATNSHTYERSVRETKGDEQWIALRKNRDWTALEY